MTSKIQLLEMEIESIMTLLHIGRFRSSDIFTMINDAINDSDTPNVFMRMFYLLTALGQRALALDMQAKALALRSIYRIVGPDQPEIRLLALMGPGDMIDNIPLEFVIENSGIRLDILYLSPYQPLPEKIPDHDIAIVALNGSDKNRPLLSEMESLFSIWPRPILNHPNHILRCARDTVSELLSGTRDLYISRTHRMHRGQQCETAFPITIRPEGSHAGQGFAKLDTTEDLLAYFDNFPAPEYFISSFVEYQSQDGLYRKYRIALINGRPYVCHVAISDHWMVHYHSANMDLSAAKRDQEAKAMDCFDLDFAIRHGKSLRTISERLGLEYVILDCAELPDGRLLLFEADIAGWIHATDSEDIFPYKPKIMQKAFDAFKSLLVERMSNRDLDDMQVNDVK